MSTESPRVPTPVTDYRHLRMVAEWASAIRNQRVDFAVREGPVTLADRDPARGVPALHVPARTPGRYGAVRSLTVSLPGVAEPLDLTRYGVDALFWSEAAVEKFLVPYCASCAGPRAGRFLGRLFDAWNGDHGEARPVALAHLTHSDGRLPLTLANAVGVVFRDAPGDGGAPALRLQPLGAFRAHHRARWTPPRERNREEAMLGATELPEDARLPTAADLRGIAEWAASVRHTTGFLRYDSAPARTEGDEERRTRRSLLPGPAANGEIVFAVHTPAAVPDRPAPVHVRLAAEEGGRADLLLHPHSDAVFTSTGAIEQFLFPYYASVRGMRAVEELAAIALAWAGVEPGDRSRGEPGGGGPLALVHLPKSDWDAAAGEEPIAAGSALDHVGVVAGGAAAPVTVRAWRAGAQR